MKWECLICKGEIVDGGFYHDSDPENKWYCEKCYPKSSMYQDKMFLLTELLNRIDSVAILILQKFVEEYDEDQETFYLKEIEKKINEERY